MKLTINLDRNVMKDAAREYFDMNPIEDLDREMAVRYALWIGCGFDEWMDTDELMNKLTDEEEEAIASEFASALKELVTDTILDKLDLRAKETNNNAD